MKKILLVVAAWIFITFIAVLQQSCDKCDPEPINQRLNSLQAELMRMDGSTFSPVNANNAGLRYDSLAIHVTHTFTAFMKQEQPVFSFFNTAYACDPAVNYDNIREIVISSSSDYNSEYPKGTNLANITQVRNDFHSNPETVSSKSNQFLYSNDAYYTFTADPGKDDSHNITIKYILTNGQGYYTTLNNVLIRK
ncbi:MAG: hypothetical protein ACXWDO_04935 [Bacteroidia bacterium]